MISQARLGEMIQQFTYRCRQHNKHMILMTGTPDGIKPILKKWIPDLHTLDFTRMTYSVMPKIIRFTHVEGVRRELELHYLNGNKFIYFYNGHAILLSDFCNGLKIKPEDGVSLFSDKKMRDALKETNLEEYNKIIEVEEYLAEHKCFPDWVKYVISTSKNREGISIENKDFTQMYVDSHIPSEVVQYAGRLRYADFTLTIVDGTFQYAYGLDINLLHEMQEDDKQYVDVLNAKFAKIQDEDYRRYLITITESPSILQNGLLTDNPNYRPYIFFDPFNFRFKFNELKVANEEYLIKCIGQWDSLDRRSRTSFSSYVRSWFPKPVEIRPYETKEWLSLYIIHKDGIIVNSDREIKKYYKIETIYKLIRQLSPIWGEFGRINTYMRRIDSTLYFSKVSSGKHKGYWELLRTQEK